MHDELVVAEEKGTRLRGNAERQKRRDRKKVNVTGEYGGICKVGASSLSAPLDKHRFAYDRHFAGSII